MMKRTSRVVFRFVMLATLALTLPAIAGRSGRTADPYLSALSDLAASRTAAASGCEFKDCAGGSRHNLACAKVTSATQCSIYQGFCLSSNCP
jgi:hypothetical protein